MIYAMTGKMAKRTDPALKKMPPEFYAFVTALTHPDVLKRPNWDQDLLKKIATVRELTFGTRSTRGKVFPGVPYDKVG